MALVHDAGDEGSPEKKEASEGKFKRVVRRELPDPGNAANVDGNVQRNYVTIRPLNREDSVLYFPPEAFGPFRVLHQIGAGTLGPVFRAHESERDRLVAVKVFRLEITPEQVSLLCRSSFRSSVAADITHPGHRGADRRRPRRRRCRTSPRSTRSAIRSTWFCGTAASFRSRTHCRSSSRCRRRSHHAAVAWCAPRVARILATSLFLLRAPGSPGLVLPTALAKISAKLPIRPLYSAPDASAMCTRWAPSRSRRLPASVSRRQTSKSSESRTAAKLRGALATVLAASGLKARTTVTPGPKASSPKDAVGTTTSARASNVSMRAPDAHVAPVLRPAVQDLDLRIDRAVDFEPQA